MAVPEDHRLYQKTVTYPPILVCKECGGRIRAKGLAFDRCILTPDLGDLSNIGFKPLTPVCVGVIATFRALTYANGLSRNRPFCFCIIFFAINLEGLIDHLIRPFSSLPVLKVIGSAKATRQKLGDWSSERTD